MTDMRATERLLEVVADQVLEVLRRAAGDSFGAGEHSRARRAFDETKKGYHCETCGISFP